jgi:cytochrome c oxidase assembly protein Cox11
MRDAAGNLQRALFLAAAFAGMVALGYAAVPLYQIARPGQRPPIAGGPDLAMIEGFCFDERSVDRAVQVCLDPVIAGAAALHGIDGIQLSYAFFQAADDNPAAPTATLSGQPAAPDGAAASSVVD